MPAERLYLYDDHALGVFPQESEAVKARHQHRYRRAIEIAGRTGGVWLDFACGSGYGTAMCAEVADWVIGADRDPVAIEYANRHHDGPGREFRLTAGDTVWDWELEFDAVLSIETLEHMSATEQRGFIRAAAEHLTPSGVLVIACPIGNGGPSTSNPWHIHEPTLDELKHLLCRSFGHVHFETEEYESTSGHATQVYCAARGAGDAHHAH